MATEATDIVKDTVDSASKAVNTARRKAPAVARRARASVKAKAAAAAPAVRERVRHTKADLDQQIEEASDSIAILRQRVDALMEEATGDAKALAAQAGRSGRAMARSASHQVSVATDAVRENPLPTVIGLGLAALVTGLIVSRRDARW